MKRIRRVPPVRPRIMPSVIVNPCRASRQRRTVPALPLVIDALQPGVRQRVIVRVFTFETVRLLCPQSNFVVPWIPMREAERVFFCGSRKRAAVRIVWIKIALDDPAADSSANSVERPAHIRQQIRQVQRVFALLLRTDAEALSEVMIRDPLILNRDFRERPRSRVPHLKHPSCIRYTVRSANG